MSNSIIIALEGLVVALVSFCKTIVFALVVLLAGKLVIKHILALCEKSKLFGKTEKAVKTFVLSFIRISLYTLLAVSIIGILGVPMASIVTVLASAGVAIGLALQGALSNLAGGVMLMIFRPFRVDDFVEAAGVSGAVKEVNIFYTVFITADNKRITVPNGTLMNANIVNYSSEAYRRVDLCFACAKTESPARVQEIVLAAINSCDKVLSTPEAPFARLNGGTNEAMEFVARAWCKTEDYWEVYFDMTQRITEALGQNGVQAPAARISVER